MAAEVETSTGASKSAVRRRKRKQGKADGAAQAQGLEGKAQDQLETTLTDKNRLAIAPRSSRKPSHRNPVLSTCKTSSPEKAKTKQQRQASNSKRRLRRLAKKKRQREEKARVRQEDKEERMRVYAETGRAPPKKRFNPPPPRPEPQSAWDTGIYEGRQIWVLRPERQPPVTESWWEW
ncbi:hypothetical protein CLAFUW4_06519 [Fulvia fulva]|uniref:Uncharacterized protein n=1 Tax=Passalora fulva TaxID=5499 RepID=A0A9Q8PAN8_PASFU|nr:uncharacterized protein CLAFUR5_06667 [Fulvia fulva]KAK4621878.1 hypothetical protein CLAFUR4_06527 [Fulvia fulva]KAK4622631.1 hypothetical protein CLAFUR0_06523 [Fulvia fulva]UJO19004.1 hypothetical protein CLAFUR5_06667 [Fulvia fulva]WPV16457.1 hypothetical protein CLAFUW4_06519 [Fulvia fulva]WPV31469.1 hypothetical protein CLAFUW7_06518 [Fulvia fulva]